jgi:NADP-dependent 3-hydroxy acid dehydrogenase YdfG
MGRQGGSIPEPYGLKPEHLADVVYWLASQQATVLIEELSVHPMGQEF